ncbi:hypothetical protein THRCLA_09913 [Thraustotheca clavata]|uniref:FYVE-type domain-containing protein n=1 Tax=Thraustotheca clavata TaxID=74557 RepID=A0A1V9YU53_9STRA|nr:hypothetical protein THRCLA_09913 [Thraustotheca clavata]
MLLPQVSSQQQIWSFQELRHQVDTKDSEEVKQFKRALRKLTKSPLIVDEALLQEVEYRGNRLLQANTTHLDPTIVFLHESNGIKLYERKCNDSVLVQGTISVAGTVESIMKNFQMNTTKEFEQSMRQILPGVFYDGATIATNSHGVVPITNVHWMSLYDEQSEAPRQDMVFVSSSQLYETSRGIIIPTSDPDACITFATHLWHSIPSKSILPYSPLHTQCYRRHLSDSGFTVAATEVNDVCRVTFTLELQRCEPKATLLQWMQRLVILSLTHLTTQCRVGNPKLIQKTHWISEDSCQLCHKSFNIFHLLRRRHHCRLCGHSICNDCSTFVTIESEDMLEKSTKMELTRSCLGCAFKETPRHAEHRSSFVTSSTSASSTEDHRRTDLSRKSSHAYIRSALSSPSSVFRQSVVSLPSTHSLERTSSAMSLADSLAKTSPTSSCVSAERRARRAAMKERSYSLVETALLQRKSSQNTMTMPHQGVEVLTELGLLDKLSELGIVET